MFSTDFLIAILEWLCNKFEQASKKHTETAATHDEVIKTRTALKRDAQAEATRAKAFANKIANFLE